MQNVTVKDTLPLMSLNTTLLVTLGFFPLSEAAQEGTLLYLLGVIESTVGKQAQKSTTVWLHPP